MGTKCRFMKRQISVHEMQARQGGADKNVEHDKAEEKRMQCAADKTRDGEQARRMPSDNKDPMRRPLRDAQRVPKSRER